MARTFSYTLRGKAKCLQACNFLYLTGHLFINTGVTYAFFKASGKVPLSMALLIIPTIVSDITGLAILISSGGILSWSVVLDLVSVRFWLPHFRLCA